MKSVYHAPDAASKEAATGIVHATLTSSAEALDHAAQRLRKAIKPNTLSDSNVRAVEKLTRKLAHADRTNLSPRKTKEIQHKLTRLILVMAGNPEHSHTQKALTPLMTSDQVAKIHEPSTVVQFLGRLSQAVSAINPNTATSQAYDNLRKVISNQNAGTPFIFQRTPNGLRVIAKNSGEVVETIVSPSALHPTKRNRPATARVTREDQAVHEGIEADPSLARQMLGLEDPKPAPRIPGLGENIVNSPTTGLVSLGEVGIW